MRTSLFMTCGILFTLAACSPDENQNSLPTSRISLSTTSLVTGSTLQVTVECADPEGQLAMCTATQINPDQSQSALSLTETPEQPGRWTGSVVLTALGHYTFSAQAIDQALAVGTSSEVTVTVTAPIDIPVVTTPPVVIDPPVVVTPPVVVDPPVILNLAPSASLPTVSPDAATYEAGSEVVVSTSCIDPENNLQPGVDGCHIQILAPNGAPFIKLTSGATLALVEAGVYELKTVATDAAAQVSTSSAVSLNVVNRPPRNIALSVSSLEPLLGRSVRLTASAADPDGNLVSLKICEVTLPADVCNDVVSGSTPQSSLRGTRDENSSDVVTRRFYALARDTLGVARKSAEKPVSWKANLYVSTAGDDLNAGSENAPLKTIQSAVNKARSGDYIIVQAGTYREKVTVSKNNISLDGQGVATVLSTDNSPPSNTVPNPGVISVIDADTVNIRGFNIGNRPTAVETPYSLVKGYYGIYIGDGATNVLVENNKVRLTVSSGIVARNAIGVTVKNNVVEKTNVGTESFYDAAMPFNQGYDVANCEVRYERERDFRARQEMISMWNTIDFIVRGNEVFNGPWTINGMCVIGKEGIDAKDGSRNGKFIANTVHDILKLGIYLDASDVNSGNIDVDGNRVWNTRHGIVLAVESSATIALSDIRITNNLLYNNKEHGLFIAPFGDVKRDTGNGVRRNIKILHNTIFGNTNNGIFIGDSSTFGEANIDGVVIFNNIVARNGGRQIHNNTLRTVVAGSNLVEIGDTQGNIGGRAGRPTFVDVTSPDESTWNFRLVANPSFSTADAIDEGFGGVVNYLVSGTGTTITVSDVVLNDASGVVRLSGNNTELDIGAHEKR